jgi:AcrR family transcriptional regulator
MRKREGFMAKDTAHRIQEQAIALFKENGYANTTIEDICRATGVTKRTFYYYFTSKDQLIKDFFQNPNDLPSKTKRLLVTSDNSWGKFWAVLEQGINWRIKSGPAMMSEFLIASIRNGHDAYSAPYWLELENIFIGILQKGVELGHFQIAGDPALVLDNVKNIASGVSVHWCVAQGRFDMRDTIKKSLISLLGVRKDLLV